MTQSQIKKALRQTSIRKTDENGNTTYVFTDESINLASQELDYKLNQLNL